MNYETYDSGETRFIESNIYINETEVEICGPYHAHNFIEIALIKSGSGWHIVNGEKRRINAGDIIIIDYDIPHKFILESEQIVVCNCLFRVSSLDKKYDKSRSFCDALLSCNIYSQLLRDFSSYMHIELSGAYRYNILHIYEKMVDEYSKKSIGYVSSLKSCIIDLLVCLARTYEQQGSNNSKIIDTVKEYIIKNYSQNITICELANLVFLSNQYLCKLFKDNTGKTIVQFLQQVRIEKAIKLLLSTDKKISDISSSVGYSDLKYFNSVFKKITGTSPSKMRQL